MVWQAERLALGTKEVECWMTVENFDFKPNTCHKGKGDGVGNRRGRKQIMTCLLYTSPSPRDRQKSRMPSSA